MTPVWQLRLVQVVLILVALGVAAFDVSRKLAIHGGMTPFHWFVAGLAVYGGFSGFKVQKILNRPVRPNPRRRSTPFSRWRAGHLVRLFCALSVAMWGVVLSEFYGPSWVVYALYALGLLLLLIWTPGANPVPEQPEPLNR